MRSRSSRNVSPGDRARTANPPCPCQPRPRSAAAKARDPRPGAPRCHRRSHRSGTGTAPRSRPPARDLRRLELLGALANRRRLLERSHSGTTPAPTGRGRGMRRHKRQLGVDSRSAGDRAPNRGTRSRTSRPAWPARSPSVLEQRQRRHHRQRGLAPAVATQPARLFRHLRLDLRPICSATAGHRRRRGRRRISQ